MIRLYVIIEQHCTRKWGELQKWNKCKKRRFGISFVFMHNFSTYVVLIIIEFRHASLMRFNELNMMTLWSAKKIKVRYFSTLTAYSHHQTMKYEWAECASCLVIVKFRAIKRYSAWMKKCCALSRTLDMNIGCELRLI